MGIRIIRYSRELMALLTKTTVEAHSDVPEDAECIGVVMDGNFVLLIMRSAQWNDSGEFNPTWRAGKKVIALPNDYYSPSENTEYRNTALNNTMAYEPSCSGVPKPPADSSDSSAPSNVIEFKKPPLKISN